MLGGANPGQSHRKTSGTWNFIGTIRFSCVHLCIHSSRERSHKQFTRKLKICWEESALRIPLNDKLITFQVLHTWTINQMKQRRARRRCRQYITCQTPWVNRKSEHGFFFISFFRRRRRRVHFNYCGNCSNVKQNITRARTNYKFFTVALSAHRSSPSGRAMAHKRWTTTYDDVHMAEENPFVSHKIQFEFNFAWKTNSFSVDAGYPIPTHHTHTSRTNG